MSLQANIKFDIQVCFSVITKWASAMELSARIPDNLDIEQFNHITNAAWQLIMDTHLASPPI